MEIYCSSLEAFKEMTNEEAFSKKYANTVSVAGFPAIEYFVILSAVHRTLGIPVLLRISIGKAYLSESVRNFDLQKDLDTNTATIIAASAEKTWTEEAIITANTENQITIPFNSLSL